MHAAERVMMDSKEFLSVPHGTPGTVLEVAGANSPAVPYYRVSFDNGRVLWLYLDEVRPESVPC